MIAGLPIYAGTRGVPRPEVVHVPGNSEQFESPGASGAGSAMPARFRRRQRGFTLIELMVVVVIAAIIATIAYPAYVNYVMRGKIPDATSALAAKRVQMEQYFQDNHTYVSAPACATDTTTSPYFTFSCTGTVDANTYTLQAVGGNGGNQSMAGFTYTIDQNNNKTSAVAAPARSNWVGSNPSCWITKPGGVC